MKVGGERQRFVDTALFVGFENGGVKPRTADSKARRHILP